MSVVPPPTRSSARAGAGWPTLKADMSVGDGDGGRLEPAGEADPEPLALAPGEGCDGLLVGELVGMPAGIEPRAPSLEDGVAAAGRRLGTFASSPANTTATVRKPDSSDPATIRRAGTVGAY